MRAIEYVRLCLRMNYIHVYSLKTSKVDWKKQHDEKRILPKRFDNVRCEERSEMANGIDALIFP